MSDFKDKRFCSDVFQFIAKHQLIQPQKRYLLGVSGGIDSMVLLHFFQRFAHKRYGCFFAVAHLDHGLRIESAKQAERLKAYCQSLSVPYFSKRVELKTVQGDLEARARHARYSWFFQLVESQGFDAVLTAHHAKDQLETVLMQYLRGGIHLCGMPPQQNMLTNLTVIRPFLSISRSQLEQYQKYYRLLCLEDSSNQDMCFTRNRLRHQILPLLMQENANLEVNATPQALVRQAEQDYLEVQVNALYLQHVKQKERDFVVSVVSLGEMHLALQRLLIKKILKNLTGQWLYFENQHIESIRQLADGENKKQIDLPLRVRVRKFKHLLYFKIYSQNKFLKDALQ